MDAQEFITRAKDQGTLVRVAHFDDEGLPNGAGEALIVDGLNRIAVMLTECNKDETGIGPGAIVQFSRHPEARAEPRIVGRPAYPPGH